MLELRDIYNFVRVIKPGNSGTPALTSRGFVEEDFVKVAEFFDAAVKLALKIKSDSKGSLKSLNLINALYI